MTESIGVQRWYKMPHRIIDDKLLIAVPKWRTVLAAGSTVNAPAAEAVYGTNYSDFGSGSEVKYYKDPFGIVRLTGSFKRTAGIATGQTILTLPVGFRPPARCGFVVPANNNTPDFTTVHVLSSGIIEVRGFTTAANSEARTYLDISFRAETSASDV